MVLWLSRHQARPEDVRIDEGLQRTLVQYFAQPAAVLGKLRHEAQPFTYRGSETAERDQQFSRP